MAQKVITLLAGYFNQPGGESAAGPAGVPSKRPLLVFQQELKALTAAEKNELALLVAGHPRQGRRTAGGVVQREQDGLAVRLKSACSYEGRNHE